MWCDEGIVPSQHECGVSREHGCGVIVVVYQIPLSL